MPFHAKPNGEIVRVDETGAPVPPDQVEWMRKTFARIRQEQWERLPLPKLSEPDMFKVRFHDYTREFAVPQFWPLIALPADPPEPRQCAGCTAMIAFGPDEAFCVYCLHRVNLEAASGDLVENLHLATPLDARIAEARERPEEPGFGAWSTPSDEGP